MDLDEGAGPIFASGLRLAYDDSKGCHLFGSPKQKPHPSFPPATPITFLFPLSAFASLSLTVSPPHSPTCGLP